jgi:hypothetical protein
MDTTQANEFECYTFNGIRWEYRGISRSLPGQTKEELTRALKGAFGLNPPPGCDGIALHHIVWTHGYAARTGF